MNLFRTGLVVFGVVFFPLPAIATGEINPDPCLTAVDSLTRIVGEVNARINLTSADVIKGTITKAEVTDRFHAYGLEMDTGVREFDLACHEWQTPRLRHYRGTMLDFVKKAMATYDVMVQLIDEMGHHKHLEAMSRRRTHNRR